jgi:DNA-binding PadR family transcriptional regulator
MTVAPSDAPRRSSLGLIVLFQLMNEPMHVYAMQKQFEATGKDRVVNVRSRANLYQTIDRLQRHGLVEVTETNRTEGYPDRVLYRTTPAGLEVAREWLREMLRGTDTEYPEFIAALSILFGLPPEEARAELKARADRLAVALADSESSLAQAPASLPRLFLLEEEYRKAMLEAELSWIHGLIADIHDGRLSWNEEWLREVAEAFLPPTEDTQE